MTKKLFLALLAPLFMGGLVACNKQAINDLNTEGQSTGDTYMSVTFSTANPNSTRAAVEEDKNFNSIGEYIGRDEIKNVNVYVINVPEETVDVKKFTSVTMDPDKNTNTNDFRTDAWKTTAGEKVVYVYVNIANTDIESKLDKATSRKAFEDANEHAYTLTDANGVMSSYAKFENDKDIIAMNTVTPVDLTVKPGISKAKAEDNTNPDNRAKVSVRRLVAQAAVTSSASEYEIKETHGGAEKTLGKLSGLMWDVMQYEQTTYLMPLSTETDKDAKMAMYCKSPFFSFTPDATTYSASNAGGKYFYRVFNGTKVETFTRSTKIGDEKNKEDVTNIVKNPMKFITETTHQHGGKIELTGPKTGYRKGNTAYVIVSAKITPDNNAWATSEQTGYTEGKDLYFGVQDHKFYTSLDNAKKANKPTTATLEGAKDNVIKYTKGICYYVAWLNPDNTKEPVVSPVLRNNIYHVNISAIKKLGYSGNPFNPKGDDPKDPDDPTPDPKETLYPVDTYMSVEINVVNWGVHSYDNEF